MERQETYIKNIVLFTNQTSCHEWRCCAPRMHVGICFHKFREDWTNIVDRREVLDLVKKWMEPFFKVHWARECLFKIKVTVDIYHIYDVGIFFFLSWLHWASCRVFIMLNIFLKRTLTTEIAAHKTYRVMFFTHTSLTLWL